MRTHAAPRALSPGAGPAALAALRLPVPRPAAARLGLPLVRALRRFTVRATLPPELAALGELVMNLRWSWHPETLDLFEAVDPDLWAACNRDPVKLLGAVSAERLRALARDKRFGRRLSDAHDDLEEYLTGPRWYQQQAGAAGGAELPSSIAYFSPEFGITEVLPQYSGGLGILAGDHLKSASDLGVPLVAVGLLYRHGYFTQSLSADGWQAEHYPPDDPNGLPLTLLRHPGGRTEYPPVPPGGAGPEGPDYRASAPAGDPVKVSVALADGKVLTAQVWLAQVGRVPLLM